MMTTSNDENTTYNQVLQFLRDNHRDYTRFEMQEILACAKRANIDFIARTDVIREIYDELGLIPDDLNIYLTFLERLEDTFGIEGKNICEVGGGIIPRLSKRIHLKQKTGTITVYDPRLGQNVQGDDRFYLKREIFHPSTPIAHMDLLIGLMPCEGTESLLDSALRYKKDFMLWLCEGGPHGDYFDYFESDDEWLHSTISQAERSVKKNQMGKLKMITLPHFSEYPIIYNER